MAQKKGAGQRKGGRKRVSLIIGRLKFACLAGRESCYDSAPGIERVRSSYKLDRLESAQQISGIMTALLGGIPSSRKHFVLHSVLFHSCITAFGQDEWYKWHLHNGALNFITLSVSHRRVDVPKIGGQSSHFGFGATSKRVDVATVALARPAALDGFAVPLRGGREGGHWGKPETEERWNC